MKLKNVILEDEGLWSCELEEYKLWGIRGNKDKMEVELRINSPVEYDDWQSRESGSKRMDTEAFADNTNKKLDVTSMSSPATNQDAFVTHNKTEGINTTDTYHSIYEISTIGYVKNNHSFRKGNLSIVTIVTNDPLLNDSMSIQRKGTDDENDRNITPIIIASSLVLIFGATIAMLVLHFTGKLSPKFYTLGGVLKRKKEEDAFDTYLEKDVKSDIDKR